MPVARDIMTQSPECVGEHETLADAAVKMRDLDVGALPICGDDDRLKGMLTDRDIVVRAVAAGQNPQQVQAGELAQGKPVWVDAQASLDDVRRKMAEHQVRRLPVIENGKLVGIISQADVAQSHEDAKTGEMVEAISQH
jgi:CBS domain-containing protein